jgi:hypothetical protein
MRRLLLAAALLASAGSAALAGHGVSHSAGAAAAVEAGGRGQSHVRGQRPAPQLSMVLPRAIQTGDLATIEYEGETVTLAVPSGFRIGFAETTSFMEFAKPPETVDDWTILFTYIALDHQEAGLEQLRDAFKEEFHAGCARKGSLSRDWPVDTTGPVPTMDWIEACDLVTDGPSKGLSEVNLFHYMSGRTTDAVVAVAFRYNPSPDEIARWRAFLGRSELKLK